MRVLGGPSVHWVFELLALVCFRFPRLRLAVNQTAWPQLCTFYNEVISMTATAAGQRVTVMTTVVGSKSLNDGVMSSYAVGITASVIRVDEM